MAELKCPCHLRDDMDWDDCEEMDCNECCPLSKEQSNAVQRVANTDNVLTNADRIRSMSDEELAKWLAGMWDCCYCSEYDRTGGHPLFSAEPCDQKCEQHCFDWLKQPYKEEK